MPFDAVSDLSDDALLVLFANGDGLAARALTHRLSPLALRVSTRLLGDQAEAEDVTQEAMVRLWKAAPDWRQGEAKVSTWLFTVVRNLCLDRIRKRGRAATNPLDAGPEPEDGAPSVQQQMTQADRSAALHAALDTLPDRQKEAVVLRHLEGLTNPEIAEIMGITVEAVESLTARGKRALTKALAHRREDLGYEDD